eukprot:690958-Pleurochrysis_carterae.AAC.2
MWTDDGIVEATLAMLGAEASCKLAPGVECWLLGTASRDTSICRDIARAGCSFLRRRSWRQASADACGKFARNGCLEGACGASDASPYG